MAIGPEGSLARDPAQAPTHRASANADRTHAALPMRAEPISREL